MEWRASNLQPRHASVHSASGAGQCARGVEDGSLAWSYAARGSRNQPPSCGSGWPKSSMIGRPY
eukprot:6117906-Alexandrium_andersonii.AAC.1